MELNKKTDVGRIGFFDTLRLGAIFIIFITHFIDFFCPEYFDLWTTSPYSLLLKGITGKLGVALLGVLLGYFAYLSKETNASRYVLKRYIFFLICGFISNLLYAIAGQLFPGFYPFQFDSVIKQSVLLTSNINETFWCIPAFFAASIISYLNGKVKAPSIAIIMEILVFFWCKQVWISVCLMGNLIVIAEEQRALSFLKYRLVRIGIWIVLFFAIKQPVSDMAYIIQGVCCTIMILLIMRGSIVKKMLNLKVMSSIGRRGMAIFLIHVVFYRALGPILFQAFSFLPYTGAFWSTFVICFVVTIIAAYLVMWIIDMLMKYTSMALSKIIK